MTIDCIVIRTKPSPQRVIHLPLQKLKLLCTWHTKGLLLVKSTLLMILPLTMMTFDFTCKWRLRCKLFKHQPQSLPAGRAWGLSWWHKQGWAHSLPGIWSRSRRWCPVRRCDKFPDCCCYHSSCKSANLCNLKQSDQLCEWTGEGLVGDVKKKTKRRNILFKKQIYEFKSYIHQASPWSIPWVRDVICIRDNISPQTALIKPCHPYVLYQTPCLLCLLQSIKLLLNNLSARDPHSCWRCNVFPARSSP